MFVIDRSLGIVRNARGRLVTIIIAEKTIVKADGAK